MEETESNSPTDRVALLVAAIIIATTLGWFAHRVASRTSSPAAPTTITDAAQIAKNEQAFKDCIKDRVLCNGALMKYVNGPVVRIVNCGNPSCGEYTLGTTMLDLTSQHLSERAAAVEWVALPPHKGASWGNRDEAKWCEAAMTIEEQFAGMKK